MDEVITAYRSAFPTQITSGGRGEIAALTNVNDLGQWFSNKQVYYLSISREDLDFLLQHDPYGVMEQALMRLSEWR